MKRMLFSSLILLSIGIRATGEAAGRDYEIGDMGPSGGYVFYEKSDYSDGWRYLEAAPVDTHSRVAWNPADYQDIKTSAEIGSGRTNTYSITSTHGPGRYAASICRDLTLNGYSDWFLPSKKELELMYRNLRARDIGDFTDDWYWSSSQAESYGAWIQIFSNGDQVSSYKTLELTIRAIRCF